MERRSALSRREMLEALRAAGCRITGQRTAIVDYLAGRSDHPGVRQIYAAVREHLPGLCLTTVYNTLSTLISMGLVRAIEFDDRENRYDTNLAPHVNLVCTGCGQIADFDQPLPVPRDAVLRQTGFEASEYRLEYRGLCYGCRQREGGTRR